MMDKRWEMQCWVLLIAFFLTSAVPVGYAEDEGQPGNPFAGTPPEAGVPTDPSDFDDGDQVPPDAGFGLAPQTQLQNPAVQQPNPNDPLNPFGAPPTTGNQNTLPSRPSVPNTRPNTPPIRSARPSNPSGSRGSRATTPQAPSTSGAQNNPFATAKQKPQQKLADYLELDNSVKGLEVKNFDLPDKDIKDVVLLISKWTGKNFILDAKVRGKITIVGPAQVTLQEAYQAFLSALEANSLTTVQSGKFIRIIESAEARRAPVKTYAGEYAPKDDQFITRVFQLKYINADEVQREFRDLTTRQGKLFAYEPTNSIIITDTGSNIYRIKELLETLDVKSFESTLHLLKIRHSSAKSIAEMLANIYGEGKGGAASTRSFRRSALERTRGGGIISKILPDETTNSLVVLANQAGFEQLKQLVGKLDVKTIDTGKIHVYYCEYAKAEDLASTLASLSGGSSGGSRRGSSSRTSTPPAGAGGTTAAANPLGSSSGPVTAELGEGVKITSDAATNSLVITANSSDYQTLKRVIKRLDIPRLQVLVETAILEINLDGSEHWKANAAAGAPGQGFAGGFISDPTTLVQYVAKTGLPTGATLPFFLGPQFSGNVSGTTVPVATFMGLVNLITSSTNTSVLSTPQIIALDNEKAEFQVQDNIPVVASTTQTANVGTTQSIDYKKVGIDIKLTPHINASSGVVRLEIEQDVSSIKSVTLPSQVNNQSIATTTRKTTTSVVVKNQDYIALGGLMSDKVSEQTDKVPLLGDIPILGWLFKSKTHSIVKTNLVILLKPTIIGNALASADQINSTLKKRDEFIKNNMNSDDEHQKGVDEIKKAMEEQQVRGASEPVVDYTNRDEEDEPKKADEPPPLSPGGSR